MNRTVSTFLLTATLLLGGLCGAVSARPQTMAMASSVEVAQPAPVRSDLAMESEAMSIEPSREGSGFSRPPPTHQQRCQASCRGIKGASAHSKCIHNCMSRH